MAMTLTSDSVATVMPSRFAPTEALRAWLGWAAVAALLDGCLLATSSAADLLQGKQDGLTIAMILSLAAILPQSVVLRAFLTLAEELQSNSLRKSCLGVFALSWLLHLVALSDPAILARGGMIGVQVSLILSLIGLIAVMLKDVRPTAESGSWLAGATVIGFLVLKYGLKIGVRVVRRFGIDLGLEEVAMLEGGVLLLFLFGFMVWFAVVKIRLRQQLGPVSVLSGGFDLLQIVVGGCLIAWLIAMLVSAMNMQPPVGEDDVEVLFASWFKIFSGFSIVQAVVGSALTAILLLSIKALPRDEEMQLLSAGHAASITRPTYP